MQTPNEKGWVIREAFKLACEFRDKTIQRLREEGYDYSDTHGE